MKVQVLAWEIRDSVGKPGLVNLQNLIQSGIEEKEGWFSKARAVRKSERATPGKGRWEGGRR